jgi:L-threonylcarbamoyladenylate synthase
VVIVPAAEGMDEAVERLRAGRLVAFPTETVYGLGANALQTEAVVGIFAAKGRPSSNPLIVHVADVEGVLPLVRDWPTIATALAERFWPGPLTLVVPKSDAVPAIVTAGGETVAVRVPRHPVAQELLRRTDLPIAAPSANRSEEVSPTTAQHVADSLGPFVEDLLILDGGPCSVGVESTVLDVSQDPPRILRPGMVTSEDLREWLGNTTEAPATAESLIARSPGQRARHYAPRVPVIIVPASSLSDALHPGDGFLSYGDYRSSIVDVLIPMPDSATAYAARLFEALRGLDRAGVQRIVVEEPPLGPEWDAIQDRLRRAATPAESDTP